MSDRPPPADERPAEPKPKKKRRKPDEGDPRPRAAEAADTSPRSDELDALIAAFDAGNYAFVRKEAPRLARSTDDDAVRAAARDLMRRIDPDPIAKWMMGGAGLLLASLAGWYWMHAHGGP